MKAILILALISLTACADGNRIFRDGVDGRDGKDGHSCSVAQAVDGSGALITCGDSAAFVSNGATGPKGDQGDTGATGATGAAGVDGTNGTNATPVTLVQLCPQFTGSYGNFPEFAFNVNGKLYGVYSTSGVAFLAQFYPGLYTTTTHGSNCNFTVNADGSLSH